MTRPLNGSDAAGDLVLIQGQATEQTTANMVCLERNKSLIYLYLRQSTREGRNGALFLLNHLLECTGIAIDLLGSSKLSASSSRVSNISSFNCLSNPVSSPYFFNGIQRQMRR